MYFGPRLISADLPSQVTKNQYCFDAHAVRGDPPWCEQSSLNSRSNEHCHGAAMAPLCKLVKRGAVRANDLPLSNDFEAWPDSSVGRAPTYKVRGREFESRSGRLFSRTFTFHFFQTLLLLLNIYIYIYIYI